jgi:sensor histidine kinase YesM
MKSLFTWEKFRFYIWLGGGYFILQSINTLHSNPETFGPRTINNVWLISYLTVLNFILFEFTIPQIRKKRNILGRIFLTIFLIWAQLMLFSYGLYGWRALGIVMHVYTSMKNFPTVDEGVTYHMAFSVASVFFFGIVRHIYRYLKLQATAKKLRIEKQEAELNYLKSQTNPHFLFNTLNNIYSLARDKSDLAPESILRLSKILRYMLYEAGGQYVAIEQELKIINDYIALEKLRYDESLRVNFNHDIEDMKQAIPPLLLIPLVENAFKHGVSETRYQPFVNIHIAVNKRRLTLLVKNSTEPFAGTNKVVENIGLSNLRRQLELLYTDYELSVEQGDAVFTASLKINLASHV